MIRIYFQHTFLAEITKSECIASFFCIATDRYIMCLLWCPFAHVFCTRIPWPVEKQSCIPYFEITTQHHFLSEIFSTIQCLPLSHFVNGCLVDKQSYCTKHGGIRIGSLHRCQSHFRTFCNRCNLRSNRWFCPGEVVGVGDSTSFNATLP